MRLNLNLDDTQCEVCKDILIVRFSQPFKALSSAVLNSGLFKTRAIINRHVPKNYEHDDSANLLINVIKEMNLPKETVGFLTAVDVQKLSFVTDKIDELTVSAIVTAGLGYPAAAGDDVKTLKKIGTINTIILIDKNLTEGCMVNCIQTAVEAKTIALRELDIRSHFSNTIASGSTSDAIIVACKEMGEPIKYAGTATELGMMIGQNVKKATKRAIQNYDKTMPERSIINRLSERGIEIDDMVNAGLELFMPTHILQSKDKVSELLRDELIKTLSDVNISALILAALRLQEDGENGLIPGLPKENFIKDPIFLVADESIGSAIANYISGTWGFYNFLYFERKKPGLIKKLGPFLDDAIGGLIAGSLSDIYTKNREK